MAQSEDTELRDLVIEALEKNGSLAKIRALLRANIFLAFEDDCENMKQNASLDSILKLPEGILSLSIVHEFLEFCNLKNTLFVYKSESRQGHEYKYEGQKNLSERVKFLKRDSIKEPVLVTLIKTILKPFQRRYFDDFSSHNKREKLPDAIDDQNCTYIVHEDSSSTTSNSQSDNSSDEKNKLHLRLQLDNSDTDTSSDSARDKSSSEYIPSEHILQHEAKEVKPGNIMPESQHKNITSPVSLSLNKKTQNFANYSVTDLPYLNSSDSTSYAELKPYNKMEQKLLNTAGLPIVEIDEMEVSSPILLPVQNHKTKSLNDSTDEKSKSKPDSASSSATLSNVSSLSPKNDCNSVIPISEEATPTTNEKSVSQTSDYSLDFTTSPTKDKNPDKKLNSPESIKEELPSNEKSHVSVESPHQNSQSSQSSVSISDVADLLEYSDRNSVHDQTSAGKTDKTDYANKSNSQKKNKSFSSVDSGDFSESPIPSLSNLSLEIHSD